MLHEFASGKELFVVCNDFCTERLIITDCLQTIHPLYP